MKVQELMDILCSLEKDLDIKVQVGDNCEPVNNIGYCLAKGSKYYFIKLGDAQGRKTYTNEEYEHILSLTL